LISVKDGLPKQNRSAPIGGRGNKIPRKPEEGSAVEDILKQDFGLLNEDRLDGELAPIEAAL
jgi:hypothetical protein